MTEFQKEMNHIVERFVQDITEIARRAAVDTLQAAFGPRTVKSRRAALVSPVGRPRGRRGEKRTSEEIETLSQRFVSFVMRNPGLRVEQINKGLGTTTKDLVLPIRKLIAEGVIRAKGQKRSTTYSAVDAAKN